MSDRRPLSILLVTRTPWQRNLGASRVYVELAEALVAQGHRVKKFSCEDAFPQRPRPLQQRLPTKPGRVVSALAAGRSFAARAHKFVLAQGQGFDVIDVNHTDLSASKMALGFRGLLVARSVAFFPTYEEFQDYAEVRWKEPWSVRGLLHRLLFFPQQYQNLRNWPRALRFCDLINVSSRYDETWARERLGYGEKVTYFPFGLSADRARELAEARYGPAERLRRTTVVFIGTWNSRKGARDWPLIIGHVLDRVPEARFKMLGTGMGADVVLRDFAPEHRRLIEVVPGFESGELPALLADATVGAFPGYLESFGFSVLEKLGAGLPTAVYDAPGPRDIAGHLARSTMAKRGDVEGFARLVSDLLTLDLGEYERYSEDAMQAASHFRWDAIARGTAEVYAERLERLGVHRK